MAKNVTTIPATLNRFTADPISSRKKRRIRNLPGRRRQLRIPKAREERSRKKYRKLTRRLHRN